MEKVREEEEDREGGGQAVVLVVTSREGVTGTQQEKDYKGKSGSSRESARHSL